MNFAKIASKAERAATESRYARINWNAHLVPIVREVFGEFETQLKAKGYYLPRFSLTSEAVSRGEIVLDQTKYLGDSISVQFGMRPIARHLLAPLDKNSPILVEEGAALVFSQAAASGVAIVLLYPPSSELSTPTQPYYLIGSYQNPSDLTGSEVRKRLNDLFELDRCCTSQTAPSAACGKLIVKLEARAKAIQSGSAGIFTYVKYVGYLVRGLWFWYRASHASP